MIKIKRQITNIRNDTDDTITSIDTKRICDHNELYPNISDNLEEMYKFL